MKDTIATPLPSAKPGRLGPTEIAAAWVKEAVKTIENPGGDLGEDLHFVRGTLKRLRAILRMIRPVIGETLFRQENHRLRSAAHALSNPREKAVNRETLKKLAKSVKKKKERKAFERMLEVYEAANRHQEQERDRFEETMRAAGRALRCSEARIQQLSVDANAWRTIGPGFERVYRSGRRRMKKAIAGQEDVAFHRWRIRARNLDDQLEYLAPFWPKHLGRMKSRLAKLKGKLGSDHDLVTLKAALQRIAFGPEDSSAVECVLERMKKRGEKLRSASRKLGEAIFHEKPVHLAHRLEKHWRKCRETPAKSRREK